MMPYGPDQFLHFETQRGELHGRHFFLPNIRVSTVERPRCVVGFHILGSTEDAEISEVDLNRLLCHALIQHLPDERLSEAFEDLSDMYTFSLTTSKPLPLPTRTVKARVGKSVVRPVYPISDEE